MSSVHINASYKYYGNSDKIYLELTVSLFLLVIKKPERRNHLTEQEKLQRKHQIIKMILQMMMITVRLVSRFFLSLSTDCGCGDHLSWVKNLRD